MSLKFSLNNSSETSPGIPSGFPTKVFFLGTLSEIPSKILQRLLGILSDFFSEIACQRLHGRKKNVFEIRRQISPEVASQIPARSFFFGILQELHMELVLELFQDLVLDYFQIFSKKFRES